MNIISGISSQTLSCKISSMLNICPSLIEYSKFPDNELYLQINDDVNNEDVIIIQSTTTSLDYICLLQLIDACECAKSISVVIPYMGYSRQEKRFKKGEPISAKVMAKSIECDKIYTINIHDMNIMNFFNCKSYNLNADVLLGDYIKNLNVKSPILIAPDEGATEFVSSVANIVNCEFEIFKKIRIDGNHVIINDMPISCKNNSVLFVDDIISTGGTISECIKILSKNGFRDLYAFCVHPILSKNAVLRLYNSGIKKIVSTDTIEKIQSEISVAPLVVNNIKL